MTAFAPFPSEHYVEYFLALTGNNLRTINYLRDLVINGEHLFLDYPHAFIGDMRGPQNFRDGHAGFLLCQFV